MRATTIHAPGDIRLTEAPDPVLTEPTDAIVEVTAGCICGSDLWPYRGEDDIDAGSTIGHECVGGVSPVRRFLPELLELVVSGQIEPGLVFDQTLPLEKVAEGYRAMDERRAIKVLLEP